MSKRMKVIVTIITISIISIFVLIMALLIGNNAQSPAPNNRGVSSYPVSDVDTALKFTLNQINVATPLDGKSMNYTFLSTLSAPYTTRQISESEIMINSEKFSLFMSTPAESFGGVYEARKIEEVDTQSGGYIYRVQDANSTHLLSIFKRHNPLNFAEYHFYGSGTDTECAQIFEQSYCGAPSFGIRGENVQISLYCAASDESFVKYCDEFVNNLELISKEELIRPVSYYR